MSKARKLLRSKKKGFTLIELLVVIAIIGILAIAILIILGTARKKANNVKVKEACNALAGAEEMYADDHNGDYVTGTGAPDTLKDEGYFGGFAGVVHEGTDAYGVNITDATGYTITGYDSDAEPFFVCDTMGCR